MKNRNNLDNSSIGSVIQFKQSLTLVEGSRNAPSKESVNFSESDIDQVKAS